jgi:hypothetical protein
MIIVPFYIHNSVQGLLFTHWVSLVPLITVIFTGVQQYLIVVLICTSSIIRNVEQLLRCFLAIFMLENVSSIFPFFIWVICFFFHFFFFLSSAIELSSHIFWILNPYQIHDLQIFSLNMQTALVSYFLCLTDDVQWI